MNRKGRGNSNKVVKAKGGAAPNSAPRKLSDRFDRIVQAAPKANKKKTVVVVQKKGSNPKVVKGAKKGKGNAPNPKKDNKKNNKKGKGVQKTKEKPKSAEDLDLEMATYWHKAGKGPDPQKAKLDAEMENYFAKKDAETEAPAETTAD